MESGHNDADDFDLQFAALTGFRPLCWQKRLFHQHFITGDLPSAIDVPTGLGKTSVMAIWLIARARKANVPRRLVYVVDRRAIVDQATTEAVRLQDALAARAKHFEEWDESARLRAKKTAAKLNDCLGFGKERQIPISTLRGAHVDNRDWLDDPSSPAIIVGTVDMIGSRLLFEGYGVSRKMRPYHAGLLGVDALVVLDESHLAPPFAHMLRAVEQEPSLRPNGEVDGVHLPRFVYLPLSATQRDATEVPGRVPFRLGEEDWKTDDTARLRLSGRKRLRLEALAVKDADRQLAEAALTLAMKDGTCSRVVVFCDRRDKSSDGPSVQGVVEAITSLANGEKKTGRAKVDIYPPELLAGARRVRERSTLERNLRKFGFVGKRLDLEKPAFLIATSAGEVGIDIDADHMVCDLVAWERMVQRLGRVNRRGEGDAEVRVFWSKPVVKDTDAPTEAEKRALTASLSRDIIKKLPENEDAYDASLNALRQLAESARTDGALGKLVDDATTQEPLRPAINRALLDAWSMTSLEKHTGRPGVAPWLRGWVEEAPQTTVAWRKYLPVRIENGGTVLPGKTEIEDFFEAAPLHESEKLETETFRVVSWLEERGEEFLKRKDAVLAATAASSSESDDGAERAARQGSRLLRDDVIAIILTSNGEYSGRLTLGQLNPGRKDRKAKEELHSRLMGKNVVIDARLGGLREGLLNSSHDDLPETADASADWSEESGFRVRHCLEEPKSEKDWQFEKRFVLCCDGEGTPLEWLVVEHFKTAAQKEDSRAVSKPQKLTVHQDWAQGRMRSIAKATGLPEAATNALAIGAALHDEGKRALRWQRAFDAPRDARECKLAGPLAKTRGPINQAILAGYRHEFGSLPFLEANDDFRRLPGGWQDLVLHLVAAHHGQARPLIETRGCDDGPPSLLEERARAVALRFARLQKRWGPWGLAWLETLLRAADQQASRDNDAEQSSQSEERGEIAS